MNDLDDVLSRVGSITADIPDDLTPDMAIAVLEKIDRMCRAKISARDLIFHADADHAICAVLRHVGQEKVAAVFERVVWGRHT